VTFSPPRSVTNSAFSVDDGDIRFSGRIVSATSATGIIRVGECASDAWYAEK
jgi:hypothetical protein